MKFFKRLRFFAIGIAIGITLSYLFFNDRGCNFWLPQNRVKTELFSYQFLISSQTKCILHNNNISPDSLANFIWNAKIDFSKSNVKTTPRIYKFYQNTHQIDISLNKEDSTAYINQFYHTKKDTNCLQLSTKNNQLISLPLKKIIKKTTN